MGKIAVEGMRFFAFHGYYSEEQLMGTDFVVDVYVDTSFEVQGDGDQLEGTINYQTIYLAVEIVMREPVKLIETLLHRIIMRLKFQFENIMQVKVRVSKLAPNLGGQVDRVYVEKEHSFLSKCPRCGSGFVDYKDGNCWCKKEKVYSMTQDTMKARYNACVCPKCIVEFSA